MGDDGCGGVAARTMSTADERYTLLTALMGLAALCR